MTTRRSTSRLVAVTVLLALAAGPAAAQQPAREPDIFFVPTPQEAVEMMLLLAKVGPEDVVYDLGSGDGRIVVTAAREHGARGVGVDIDPARVRDGRLRAAREGVADRVRFVEGDLFKADVSEASVVALYLLPTLNERLRPRLLEQLRPGSRVVSYAFRMGDWQPDRAVQVGGESVYLWVVPASVAGRWEVVAPEGRVHVLDLQQQYQRVFGTMTVDGVRETIREGVVHGTTLRLVTDSGRLEGRVEDDTFAGRSKPDGGVVAGRRVGEAVIAP